MNTRLTHGAEQDLGNWVEVGSECVGLTNPLTCASPVNYQLLQV